MKSKSVLGAVAALALFASSAIAADTATTAATAPLPAGKAAGTKEAGMITPAWGVILAALGVSIFVAVAATGGFNTTQAATGTGA